jgi:hypothetical protein
MTGMYAAAAIAVVAESATVAVLILQQVVRQQ